MRFFREIKWWFFSLFEKFDRSIQINHKGVDFNYTKTKRISVEKKEIDSLSFHLAQIKNASFKESVFGKCNFHYPTGTIIFENCHFDFIDMVGSDLKNVKIKNSVFKKILVFDKKGLSEKSPPKDSKTKALLEKCEKDNLKRRKNAWKGA